MSTIERAVTIFLIAALVGLTAFVLWYPAWKKAGERLEADLEFMRAMPAGVESHSLPALFDDEDPHAYLSWVDDPNTLRALNFPAGEEPDGPPLPSPEPSPAGNTNKDQR